MKKLLVTIFSLFLLLGITEVKAQTAMENSKDEFWGTPKRNPGTSTDAVGARSEALDLKYNAYEDPNKRNFRLKNYNNNKKLNEMQKKEEKLLKKHQRHKKRMARKARRN